MTDTTAAFDGTLAVIGGGRMGEAIVGGLVAKGTVAATRITVADPSEDRRRALAAAHGVKTAETGVDTLPADVVLLAVKPQVIDGVLASLGPGIQGALVVSIAAGITTARLESALPAGTPVVRVMPNTPALVGEGMAVVSGGSEASPAQVALVSALFGSIGEVVELEERYQNAATAISGSGPAYFALVIDALARAGVRQGLSRDIAERLALKTMGGTAALLDATRDHPEKLIDAVSSPGGTTIAALEALERGGVRSAFFEAVAANIARAKELGS